LVPGDLKGREETTVKMLAMKRLTIATRLLWAFLVMALVPLSVVTYLTYSISEQSLRAEVTPFSRSDRAKTWAPTFIPGRTGTPSWPGSSTLPRPSW